MALNQLFTRGEKNVPTELIDNYKLTEENMFFKETKGAIIAPLYKLCNLEENNIFNYFYMTPKKCYNSNSKFIEKTGKYSIGFREHWIRYMNYFENYYDTDHQLLSIYYYIKYCIDCYGEAYSFNSFYRDLYTKIISYEYNPLLHYDLRRMNEDCYNPMKKTYESTKNPCLEYRNMHAKIMMEMSLIILTVIPLASHFLYMNKYNAEEIKNSLLYIYDSIGNEVINYTGVNIYNKLFETITTNISKNVQANKPLWDKQPIRSINELTHANNTMENILLQIMPKYVYSENIVCFNRNCIDSDIKHTVTDIAYEAALISKSGSIRDEDQNSEVDKFEDYLNKRNEAVHLLIMVNKDKCMEKILSIYGKPSKEEVEYYLDRLVDDNKHVRSKLQNDLINFLFMKVFEDSSSLKLINNYEYVELMISASKKLLSMGLVNLAAIISSKVTKVSGRNSVNSRIKLKIVSSENYAAIIAKYSGDTIINTLFQIIARLITSEFKYISYYDKENDGAIIPVDPDLITEEILRYALLI